MDKIIALDIDDVTADLISQWLHLYNQDYDDNTEEKDIKTWEIAKYVKCGNAIYDYLKDPLLYKFVRPVPDAEWGIATLIKAGFRIIFVTASTPEQFGAKYKWLMNYDLLNHRKNYIEAFDKSLIYADYLVDDNPDNVKNARGQGIVFTKEWNKSLTDYPRVNNWYDIVKYFSKVKKQTEIIGV